MYDKDIHCHILTLVRTSIHAYTHMRMYKHVRKHMQAYIHKHGCGHRILKMTGDLESRGACYSLEMGYKPFQNLMQFTSGSLNNSLSQLHLQCNCFPTRYSIYPHIIINTEFIINIAWITVSLHATVRLLIHTTKRHYIQLYHQPYGQSELIILI